MYDWLNDHGKQHHEDLQREAEQERLANQLPRKPGLLETALTLLFTGRQTDTN